MKITINGYGAISAAGGTPAAAWSAYASGKSCWSIDPPTGLPLYRVPALPEAGPVADYASRRAPGRAALLALHAADQAVQQAGWQNEEFAILVGCSRGPTDRWEEGFQHFAQTGTAETKTSPNTTLGSLGFALAEYFGTSSLATSLSVTCSSGMHAILHGVALLQAGMAERVLVGGAEAPLTEFTLRQLTALRIYAQVPEAGAYACQPLSDPPSGMVVGEGAAFLALSREAPAGRPGLTGLAFAQEHEPSPTGISRDGAGLQQTMKKAIASGGRPDFIVAHAPGTRRGDAAEQAAIRSLYAGEPEDEVVTSLKWATGHTFGASGPLAVTAALDMLQHGQYLPLPYHKLPATPWAMGKALINATGFGGNVVSLLVAGKVD